MKTLAWIVVAALAVVGAATAAVRTIAVTRVLRGAPAAELSPLDRDNLRQTAAILHIDPASERYRDLETDVRTAAFKYGSYPVTVLLHVVPGALFLVAAPLQLSARLRRRYPSIHRSTGYLLLLLAVPFGVTGLFLAVRDPIFGVAGASASVIGGLLFLNAGGQAYRAIRRGDITHHREWMLRFLALAYAIAVIRVVSAVALMLAPVRPTAIGGAMFWLGFVISAVGAEWWIRRGSRPVVAA